VEVIEEEEEERERERARRIIWEGKRKHSLPIY
jgi:hypothetical protein